MTENTTEENGEIKNFNFDLEMIKLNEMTKEDAKKHSKVGGCDLTTLKKIAEHLHIKQSMGKGDLVDAIFSKKENIAQLALINSKSVHHMFRKDKNTFPRILNIILSYPDALQRSGALASRMQLQDKTLNDNAPIFVESARLFNDPTHNSGGIVEQHEALVAAGINTEAPHAGDITPNYIYILFKQMRNKFAEG